MAKKTSFAEQLLKGFIRSAVNQVGRDGGKVISNRTYKGEHATPVYNVTDRFDNNDNSFNVSTLDKGEGTNIKHNTPNAFLVILGGLLIQVLPYIGTIIVFFNGIYLLTKRKSAIFVSAPFNVLDRRYKLGYRVEFRTIKSGETKPLPFEQINYNKLKGIYYLTSILIFIIIVLIIKSIK